MPELAQESAPPPEPRLSWEAHAAFHFTFLMHFTKGEDRAALEAVGQLLYDMALETSEQWPAWPESPTRVELRAVAADLRHAEGFLASIGDEQRTASLDSKDVRLSIMAAKWSRRVGRIANAIEMILPPHLQPREPGAAGVAR